jgi:uncharacterized protein
VFKKNLRIIALSAVVLPSIFVFSQVPDVTVERGVTMKTRDGVTLRADIYHPSGDGKFPTLLQRTPYDKNNAAEFGRRAAARGYLVVVQDVRGRFTSEGEWYPFKHEMEDGFDTIEWAANLPGSNGKVGMFGGSYVGATQMLAAIGHPPHLAGICPVVTASNYHENWTYQGGAFEQWFNESWGSGLAQDTLNRAIRRDTNALAADTVLPLTQYPIFNISKPQTGVDLTHALAPYFIDWATHTDYDSYWRRWSIEENFQNIQVPALTVAAWYDIFQGGSLRNFVGIKEHGGSDAARNGQKLLITIGGHAGGGRNIGTVDFGAAAAEYDENSVTLDWYDYLLQSRQNDFATNKPVKIFVMGENKWRYEDAWPLERAKATSYYLHSTANANSAAGSGMLVGRAIQFSDKADTFTYDPANPVPTVGGPLCCDPQHLPAGPRDQKDVEARQDVLVYSTQPLDQDLEVTGSVILDLFAASTAVDTDFTAKLVDVWPNGYAQNLTEGILRARYRESMSEAKPIEPGKIYEYKIDMWSTSNVFLKGHVIRLEVSSSNFPRFDRNLNTGKSAATDSQFVKATQTISHDSAHPSALILPIVTR